MSSSHRSCSGRSSPASSTVPGSTGSFSYRGTLVFDSLQNIGKDQVVVRL
jgi:hypothetical protein